MLATFGGVAHAPIMLRGFYKQSSTVNNNILDANPKPFFQIAQSNQPKVLVLNSETAMHIDSDLEIELQDLKDLITQKKVFISRFKNRCHKKVTK